MELLAIKDRLRVDAGIRELVENPMAGKKLKGRFEKDRLRSHRVWPLRIIYRFDEKVITIAEIGHRKDVYR